MTATPPREVDGDKNFSNGVSSNEIPAEFTIRDLDTGETRHLAELCGRSLSGKPAAAVATVADRPEQDALYGNDTASVGRPVRGQLSIPVETAFRSLTYTEKDSTSRTFSGGNGFKKLDALSETVRVHAHRKSQEHLRYIRKVHEIHAHRGPIRCLAVSKTGRFLASAAADAKVHIWEIVSNNPVKEENSFGDRKTEQARGSSSQHYGYLGSDGVPKITFSEHCSDILDMSWSKNDFLLTASLDKTICLWHPNNASPLRRFVHDDFVTSVTFHPFDEKICVSGTSLGTLRMWHLTERKLLSRTDTDEFITATTISPDGKLLLAGTAQGRCKFYRLFDEIQGEWQLVHTTQVDVRSSRGKNNKGAKICGISFLYSDAREFMVSSNDSRIRIYRMDDKSVVFKYLGHECVESRLSGSISPCGRFVLSGSEKSEVVLWEMDISHDASRVDWSPNLNNGMHRDRCMSHESFAPQDHGHVSAAIFGTKSFYPKRGPKDPAPGQNASSGLVIITGSEDGMLGVFACL